MGFVSLVPFQLATHEYVKNPSLQLSPVFERYVHVPTLTPVVSLSNIKEGLHTVSLTFHEQ